MSLKNSNFAIVSTAVFQFYAFLPNSSLINVFVLDNRCSYYKKGTDDIFSAKKTILLKEIVLETLQTTYRKTLVRFMIAVFFFVYVEI